jgi:hypothetical protein
MKVYFGHRIFTPENPTWGDPVVTNHDVITRDVARDADAIRPCECRPLATLTYHSPDGIEWVIRAAARRTWRCPSSPTISRKRLSKCSVHSGPSGHTARRRRRCTSGSGPNCPSISIATSGRYAPTSSRRGRAGPRSAHVWRLTKENAEQAEIRRLEEAEHGTAD